MEPQIYIAPGPFELETGHTLPELRMDSGKRSAYAEILPRMRSTLVI